MNIDFNRLILSGRNILITAGPTHEALDPVRFIGNHSTGKMGFAIAKACADAGAFVILIAGPTHLTIEHSMVERINVISAEEMYEACLDHYPSCDVAVLAAAVADYRPLHRSHQKIKKADGNLVIELIKNIDIARELGRLKREDQVLAGFALETENEHSNAQKKLIAKNLDFIVLNSLRDEGAGFGHDTNVVTILDRNGNSISHEMKSKTHVADDITDEIAKHLASRMSVSDYRRVVNY